MAVAVALEGGPLICKVSGWAGRFLGHLSGTPPSCGKQHLLPSVGTWGEADPPRGAGLTPANHPMTWPEPSAVRDVGLHPEGLFQAGDQLSQDLWLLAMEGTLQAGVPAPQV